jgi:hypothetical protein
MNRSGAWTVVAGEGGTTILLRGNCQIKVSSDGKRFTLEMPWSSSPHRRLSDAKHAATQSKRRGW